MSVRKLLRRFLVILGIGLLALVAAVVTFMWQAHSRETRSRDDAAPRTGRFVKTPDAEIFVQELGPATGPPVLFVHGFGAWSETWRPMMQALADKRFRAIAVDVPPFGYSAVEGAGDYGRVDQARRLLAVLEALKARSVTLVCHSFGCRPSVTAALLEPDRFQRLVLVTAALGFGTEANPEPVREGPGLVSRLFGLGPLRHAILASLVTNPRMTRALLRRMVADPAPVTGDLVALYQRPLFLQGATQNLGDWLHAQMQADDSELARAATYAKLTMPVLLVCGDRDSITPPWQGQRLARMLPASRLVMLKGVGHLPQAENPDAFRTALLEFLRQ